MKVLCIGDLHIQKRNMGIFKCFVTELLRFMDTEPSIDTIVFLGDTLHTMNIVHTQCMNLAIDMLDRVLAHPSKVRVKVLVGNHDYIGPNEKLSTNHWLVSINNRHPRLTVVDNVIVDNDGVLLMPYVPKSTFWEILEPFFVTGNQRKKIKYIFCHQEFRHVEYEFGKVLSDTGDSLDDMEQELDNADNDDDHILRIVSGHIHKKQWLNTPHNKIVVYYTGTPYQTRFNEEPDKTIAVLDTTTGQVREVSLALPKMITIHQNVLDLYSKRAQPIQFEKLHMYKVVMHVESPTQAQRFIKSEVYKNYAKHAIMLFEYEKSDTTTTVSESDSVPPPVVTHDNFKSLFYDRIKDNENMANLFRDIMSSL